MKNTLRIASTTGMVLLIASLAACAPMSPQNNYPTNSYPQGTNSTGAFPAGSYPASNQQSAYIEYGRISNVEVMRQQGQTQGSGVGAIIGGIAGAVVGSQIGGGSGKTAATVVGGLGGAVAGNAIEQSRPGQVTETYRISVQMDNGTYRSYDLTTVGQMRIGDRVRIENGQLFRM